MKFAKRLLLGTAAAMAAVGGAQAADLPGAEPVEYVKVCNTYGEGFFYIPGGDTCLQIGGYVRAEYWAFDKDGAPGENDNLVFFARAAVSADARTETEYGTLRSYIRLEFNRISGSFQRGGVGTAASTTTGPYIRFGFIQFAGLTAGRTTSFFDFYANSNVFGTIAGSDRETQVLGYTATFGTGFSATIAIEDATERRITGGGRDTTPAGFGITNYGGQEWPDVVANLRVEQGWGSAQLSGAIHNVNPARGSGGDGDEVGYAVQAGVKLNLPFLAEGDTLFIQAAYGDGALDYVSSNYGFNGFYGTNASDFDTAAPGGAVPGVRTDTTEAFSVGAELLHYWTPSLRSVFAGSYLDIDDAVFGAGYREIIGVGSLVWSPAKKLDIGVEVGYTNVEYDSGRVDRGIGYDSFSGIMRVQRNF